MSPPPSPSEPAAGDAARDGIVPDTRPACSLTHLKGIVDRLRSPGGCPWDLEQTPASLRPFLLEEAHEAAEAIDDPDPGALCGELGDLLMNIFLQARIAEEEGRFTLSEIADQISEKLVRRHPHVFGSVVADDADAVRRNWEAIKQEEKGETGPGSAIRPLPASLPALSRGERVGAMAAEIGFDWPDADGPLEKIAEELREVRRAIAEEGQTRVEAEIGDLLFAITSLCRHQGVDGEQALRGALDRFTERFQRIEERVRAEENPTLARLDELWAVAKGEAVDPPPAPGGP